MTQGQIDRLRIGVTGHRHYVNPEAVATMTDQLFQRLVEPGRALTLVSSLADGADRLLARQCLGRAESVLEVVLPLPVGEYMVDFATPASRDEFVELLAAAQSVVVLDQFETDDREAAYERCGRAVVDRVDVLIALWDGKPARGRGGTAQIVQYALDRDIPVEVILVARESDS